MNRKPDLERTNARLRGDLLTIGVQVDHELRTPLNSIVTAAEMLKELLAKKAPETAAMTAALFSSADEMNRLMDQMRFIARASGKPQPKERLNMGKVFNWALQRVEDEMKKTNAAISGPDSWPEIEGVADWLEFIWWNFFSNALQYGGPKVKAGWRREKHEFLFWITDNGGGVPESEREQLFPAFDSLHQLNSPARGLGLSIVRRLAELQGGRCGYGKIIEDSLSFYFTLPEA